MGLGDAVEVALDGSGNAAGMQHALGLVREEFGVDRVSVHAFPGHGHLRVVACAGDPLLGMGTVLPLEISTLMLSVADGNVYRCESFSNEPSFSRPGDRLVVDMGFRSGCSMPLAIGSRIFGALGLSCRSPKTNWDSIIDALGEVTPSITLALHAAGRGDHGQILICHQDVLTAEGVARVLEQALAAEVAICTEPGQALEHVDAASKPIETVVCDSLFGEGRAHSFLRELRSLGVNAPALVLDSHDTPLGHHVAMRSGAAGYVRRSDGSDGIVNAIRKLRAGQTVGLDERKPDGRASAEPPRRLTAQECRLLLLLERGLPFKQIAREMTISESTAKGYARNIFAKLNVHSRAEAVYQARRQGVIDLLHAGARTAPVDPVQQAV
jgi:DNA-binding NarL/FixJ family response regulator